MFPNLCAEMTRHAVETVDVARVTHRTAKTVRDKINGKADFTLPEIYAIRDAFFPNLSIDYLFEREIKRSSA